MIRLANKNDMKRMLEIYAIAKNFMHSGGNPNQWNTSYPDEETLLCDIENGNLYVMTEQDGSIYACFALIEGEDETYAYIEGGTWKSPSPYATIHRIAGSGERKGVFAECTAFARTKYNHLRVDTHEDNKPMRGAVLKDGFEYRGIIYLKDSSPRLAFEWVK